MNNKVLKEVAEKVRYEHDCQSFIDGTCKPEVRFVLGLLGLNSHRYALKTNFYTDTTVRQQVAQRFNELENVEIDNLSYNSDLMVRIQCLQRPVFCSVLGE